MPHWQIGDLVMSTGNSITTYKITKICPDKGIAYIKAIKTASRGKLFDGPEWDCKIDDLILPPATYEYGGPFGYGIRLTNPKYEIGDDGDEPSGLETWYAFRAEVRNSSFHSTFKDNPFLSLNASIVTEACRFVDYMENGDFFNWSYSEEWKALIEKWNVRPIPRRLIESDELIWKLCDTNRYEKRAIEFTSCSNCLTPASSWDQNKAWFGYCSEECYNGEENPSNIPVKENIMIDQDSAALKAAQDFDPQVGDIVFIASMNAVGKVIGISNKIDMNGQKSKEMIVVSIPEADKSAVHYIYPKDVEHINYAGPQCIDKILHLFFHNSVRTAHYNLVEDQLRTTADKVITLRNEVIEMSKAKSEMHIRAQKAEGNAKKAEKRLVALSKQISDEISEKSKFQRENHQLKKQAKEAVKATPVIHHNAEEDRLRKCLTEAQMACRDVEIEKQRLEVQNAKLHKDLEWTNKGSRSETGVSLSRHSLMQSLIRWGFTAATATVLLRYLI